MDDGNPSDLVEQLQTMAQGDGTDCDVLACLKLLQHGNAEVRSWANECLSQAVKPTSADASRLAERLDELTQQCEQKNPPNPLLADELYWVITLLGRLEEPIPSSQQRLDQIANWPTDSADWSWLDSVRRQAARFLPN